MRSKTFVNLAITGLCLLLYSCTMSTPQSKRQNNKDKQLSDGYSTTSGTGSAASVDNEEANQPLDVYLSRLAGVNVSGSGANSSVTIRGVGSFSSSNEPLFLLDGQRMGSFSQVYNLVRPQDIRRVTVLKSAADTAIYGAGGFNGVILVYRKKVKK